MLNLRLQLVVCCVIAVWLQGLIGANGECCRSHKFTWRNDLDEWETSNLCDDCTKGTPYCSHGSCNIFGCNCAGGCRSGDCYDPPFALHTTGLHMRRDEQAHDIIRAADVDGDGRMSLEEARRHLASAGLPVNHVERSLEHLDYNQDLFLSAHEIDSDIK